jgi:hypothetical protein
MVFPLALHQRNLQIHVLPNLFKRIPTAVTVCITRSCSYGYVVSSGSFKASHTSSLDKSPVPCNTARV